MFVVILLSLITIPVVYLLPFLATILSKENADKWAAYWLLLLASSWTVIPILGLYFEEEALMIFKLVIALALLFLLNREKITTMNKQVQGIVEMAMTQKSNIQGQVVKVAKQYGVLE